jgi:hypothetical protein
MTNVVKEIGSGGPHERGWVRSGWPLIASES